MKHLAILIAAVMGVSAQWAAAQTGGSAKKPEQKNAR